MTTPTVPVRGDLVTALDRLKDRKYLRNEAVRRLESELRQDEQVVVLACAYNHGTLKATNPLLVTTTLRVMVVTPTFRGCDVDIIPLANVSTVSRAQQGLSAILAGNAILSLGRTGIRITAHGRHVDLANIATADADVWIAATQNLLLAPPVPRTPPTALIPVPALDAPSPVEQLTQLAALLTQGLLTQTEFDVEKARILGR